MSASAPLTVDVGNTSVSVGRWEGAEVHLQRAAGLDEAAALLADSDGPIAVVSVAPSRLARLLERLPPHRRVAVRVLELAPPGLGAPELLASAGRDRVAAALALRPGPAIGVDAGTALTVEVVDGRGTWLGGYIAPGPGLLAAALAQGTEQLPERPAGACPLVPGTATAGAIDAGLWGLAIGGVDRLVEAARAALGDPGVPIVASGGWGAAWAAASRHAGVRVDPALVHRGVRAWWALPSAS